jgi:hypothetical protein
MLLVVAGARDAQSRALVEQWTPVEVGVVTPDDLCSAGWRFDLADPERSTAVVGATQVAASEVVGVLVRLPAITPGELRRISPEDREYVAAETTAFLLSWLASLACVVLNPPCPPWLTGPLWTAERWLLTAAALRIPLAHTITRSSDAEPRRTELARGVVRSVTIVGGRCVGDRDDGLRAQARRLADAAGAPLLVTQFLEAADGFRFAHAHPWADLGDAAVRGAVLEQLQDARR